MLGEFNFQIWWVQVHTKRNLWGLDVKIISFILNEEGTEKEVCIPPILVEVNLELGVTPLMRKMLGTCS